MLTEETVPPFLVSENTAVPAELDVIAGSTRLGRGGGVAALASSSWTVIGPKLALDAALAPETAEEVNTSWLTAPALMVSLLSGRGKPGGRQGSDRGRAHLRVAVVEADRRRRAARDADRGDRCRRSW